METDYLTLFLKYIRVERQYSEETAAAYREDIQAFNDFLTANGGAKAYTEVDRLDVNVYLSHLYDRHLTRNSIARKVSSLRSFYTSNSKNTRRAYPVFSIKRSWTYYFKPSMRMIA